MSNSHITVSVPSGFFVERRTSVQTETGIRRINRRSRGAHIRLAGPSGGSVEDNRLRAALGEDQGGQKGAIQRKRNFEKAGQIAILAS